MTSLKNKIAQVVATGFGSGYGRPFSGTWGTVPAWLIAYFAIGGNQPVLAAVTVVTLFVSVWAAGEAEEIFTHDDKKIVIDEWAGMFVSLLFIPFSLTNYMIAFVAFRFFDVVKIPPARQLERLPGGWGVTMDDIMAGIQANVATQICVFLLDRYYFAVS